MKTGFQWGLLLATALGATHAGAADPVYRCGDSYSSQPCPGGKAVQADDPRSPQQRTQNLEAVRKDAKTADEMQKARLKEEAKPAQAVMPPPKAEGLDALDSPATSPGVAKKPAYFTAVAPKKAKSPPEKKKKTAKKKEKEQKKATPAVQSP
jgi:hypothetical protein